MERRSILTRLFRVKQFILFIILLAIILLFYLLNPNYLSGNNLRGVMQAMSITGIMAVGMTCLFIGGGIDLAATTISSFAGIVCALFMRGGVPWPICVVISLIAGGAMGFVVAGVVVHMRMIPFIGTIAVSNVLVGINRALTNAQPVPVPTEGFWVLGGSNVFSFIPTPFLIMVCLLIIYGLILRYSQFGRNIYLVGGNMNAARLSGLNPKKIKTILYINNSILSSLAGVVTISRMHSAGSGASDSQMSAITAAILGGVSFGGGAGTMSGCFIGILLLNFFNNGLNVLSLESYWQTIAQGALLIIALTMDFYSERSRERALKVKLNVGREEAMK